MEKLPMCRMCLVENVHMYVITNKSLQQMYEKLTDVPFVTEDGRPMLACSFCCTKLKQCCQLQRKCLEAEELLAPMLSEDYECKPSTNQENLEFGGGFIISPIENINIVQECQTECDTIKQELAAVCEEQRDVEMKVESLSEEESEEHYSASLTEDEVLEIKQETEEEEEELPEHRQRVSVMERSPVTKISKIYLRRGKVVTAKQMKQNKSIRTLEICASQSVTEFTEPDTISSTVDNCAVDTNKETQNHQNIKDLKNNLHLNRSNKIINIDDIKNHQSVAKKLFKCDISCLPNKCTECQRSFSTKTSLNYHIRTHTGEKPHKCDKCQRSFRMKSHLIKHIRAHTGEKPYKCDVCQRRFNSSNNLTRHIRIHTGEKLFKCNICQRSFIHRTSWTYHISTHTGEKPHKCDICQRSFRMKSYLINHIRAHTGEKPYKCDVCQRGFMSSNYLTKHIRIHTGEKPFKCHICQRSFTHSTSLTYHVKTHTGEKPIKCDICPRSFRMKCHLINHIRVHTGEKPYKCDVCQRGFMSSNYLTKHIRIHTGEKPYKCNICQRSFTHRSSLTYHIRKHTGEKHDNY